MSAVFGRRRRESQIRALLDLARYSPSVGHSQPWRFVLVEYRNGVKKSMRVLSAPMLEHWKATTESGVPAMPA